MATASLGPENPKLKEAKEKMDKLVKKAEEGADITAISTDPDFARVGMLIGELASEPPLSKEELAQYGDAIKDDEVPPASIPAAGYHMAYDALPPEVKEKMKPYYERIFQIEAEAENAIFFNTRLLEDGVLLRMSQDPLIQAAKDTLKQAESVYSPTVNYQQNLVIETYSQIKTVAELEFEGTKMAELSNVEHEWDGLYIEVLGLLPGCAITIEVFGPLEDSVKKLKNSYHFMAEFMGITWDDVFKNPRYVYFWENVLWPRVPEEKRQIYNVSTPNEWRDVLKEKFFDPFIQDEPELKLAPESSQVVTFWGKTFHIDEILDALSNPPRLEIVRG